METVTYLLELGVNVNQSIEGLFITFSPLMIAGEVNKIEIMKLLLNAGANINFQTREDGFTTLMRVCSLGHVEAVRLLLRYGADAEISNRYQKKAIDIAKERKQLEIVELLLWGPDHDPHEKDEVEIQKEILWETNFLVNQRRLSESERRMIVVASREGGCEEDEEGDDDYSLVYARTTTYHRYADMNSDSDYDSN